MEKLKIEYVDIDSIKPYEKNAKLHPQEQIEQIKKSIEQFGMDDPIGIWKDEIVEGHGRLIACKELEYTEVPIIRLDHLTDEERKAYTLAHNKLTMNSDFDINILNDELMNSFDTIDMSDFGFDIDFDTEEETEVIEDEVPDVPEEPKAKLGDIYQLGNHRLMCGDSTKEEDVNKLMNGVKADMVFTDPPYGMNLDTDYSKMEGNGRKGKTYSKVIGDNEDFKDDLIKTVFDNFNYCNEIFLWGVDYYFDLIPDFKEGNLIVWDKTLQTNGDAGYNSEFELLWTKNQHKKEVIHFNWFRYFGLSAQDMKTREHPTQKPLQVITPFIDKYSKENDLIVDIYGGSGSTLIACEQLNRKCYMMELDPHYIDVIIQRWENFTGEKAIKLN
ncbi:MAG: site-specific DNA-methyltransferase [Clostridia bacterium]|nr:site-specific DNA-methyltransferase [Clostridia bacterium]MBR1653708.1 site-specific DNA-methyltransferase [Clostridia bacterium]